MMLVKQSRPELCFSASHTLRLHVSPQTIGLLSSGNFVEKAEVIINIPRITQLCRRKRTKLLSLTYQG